MSCVIVRHKLGGNLIRMSLTFPTAILLLIRQEPFQLAMFVLVESLPWVSWRWHVGGMDCHIKCLDRRAHEAENNRRGRSSSLHGIPCLVHDASLRDIKEKAKSRPRRSDHFSVNIPAPGQSSHSPSSIHPPTYSSRSSESIHPASRSNVLKMQFKFFSVLAGALAVQAMSSTQQGQAMEQSEQGQAVQATQQMDQSEQVHQLEQIAKDIENQEIKMHQHDVAITIPDATDIDNVLGNLTLVLNEVTSYVRNNVTSATLAAQFSVGLLTR